MEIKNVCIYCSSSNSLKQEFYNDGVELGRLLAKDGFNIVYGGSSLGIMYQTSKAAKDMGAKVIGIMPEKLYDLGFSEKFCDEFYLTKGMRERKALLDEKSQAVIALAGGFGTLEEVSEMIVQKQLRYNSKPIIFLNTLGFYDNLIKFFDDIIDGNFASKEANKLYFVAKTPKEAVEYLKNYKIETIKDDLRDEILKR